MSDRIVVMNRGRVEQVATPVEIYQRPATVFVADFIGRANFIEVSLSRVSHGTADVTVFGRQMTVPAHEAVTSRDTTALLMVRPETITVTAQTEGAIGTVLRSTFHGHSVDLDIETTSGTLSVTAPGYDPQRLPAEGTNVDVVIDPTRAFVLRRED